MGPQPPKAGGVEGPWERPAGSREERGRTKARRLSNAFQQHFWFDGLPALTREIALPRSVGGVFVVALVGLVGLVGFVLDGGLLGLLHAPRGALLLVGDALL